VESVAAKNNKPVVESVAAKNNKPVVESVAAKNNKPVAESVAATDNKPIVESFAAKPSIGDKIAAIFTSTDLASNIIKLCITIIVILILIVIGNIAMNVAGNFRDSLLYMSASIVIFAISEILLPKFLGDSMPVQISSVVLIGVGTLLALISLKKLFDYLKNGKINSPWILRGTKSARNSMVIPQDPNNPETVILYRSDNEKDGIEFTYNFWMIVDNYGYKTNEWKHIMHKGDKNSEPNMCPGFWLHPKENTMRIYFNTMKNMKEHVDIKDIPLKKWVNVSITIKQRILQVYINGNMKRRHELSSIPRQNYGDLWVNLFGGFDGFVSKIRYHRRALHHSEIEKLINDGPSKSACVDSGSTPPYLDDDWWLKRDD
jgi:hypothetical protein